MARRAGVAWFLFLACSTAAGGTWGCSYFTGVSFKQHAKEFLETTVVPLWRFGPAPDLQQPNDLKNFQNE